MAQLTKDDIDNFLMPGSAARPTISVGVYRQKRGAMSMHAMLRDRYPVEIAAIATESRRFYVLAQDQLAFSGLQAKEIALERCNHL